MNKLAVFGIQVCAIGLAAAQNVPATPRPSSTTAADMAQEGRTWSGILVDSKCVSGMSASGNTLPGGQMTKGGSTVVGSDSLMNRTSPAGLARDVNTTDRNTSGVADRVGTTNPGGRTANSADRQNADGMRRTTPTDMARTTNAAATGSPTDTQSGNNHAMNPVGDGAKSGGNSAWDRSCFISPASSEFVLQLQDGRKMRIDAAGNSRIVSEMQSSGRVSKTNKVFRVRITGSAQGDTLHIDDLKM